MEAAPSDMLDRVLRPQWGNRTHDISMERIAACGPEGLDGADVRAGHRAKQIGGGHEITGVRRKDRPGREKAVRRDGDLCSKALPRIDWIVVDRKGVRDEGPGEFRIGPST